MFWGIGAGILRCSWCQEGKGGDGEEVGGNRKNIVSGNGDLQDNS